MTLGSPSSLSHGFGFFKDADSHVAPPSDLGIAVGAGDNAPIGRMGRDGESIAATLAAPERESVRVRVDRLNDTASILVGRTTGEEWLNGASLFLKRPLSSNFLCGGTHAIGYQRFLALVSTVFYKNWSHKYLNRICMQPRRTMPKKFSTWYSQRITSRRK